MSKYNKFDMVYDIESSSNVFILSYYRPIYRNLFSFIWQPGAALIDETEIKQAINNAIPKIQEKVNGVLHKTEMIKAIHINANDPTTLMKNMILPSLLTEYNYHMHQDELLGLLLKAYGQEYINIEGQNPKVNNSYNKFIKFVLNKYGRLAGYRFGYNTRAYDEGMIAVLLAQYATSVLDPDTNPDAQMDPALMRSWSDNFIKAKSVYDAFSGNSVYTEYFKMITDSKRFIDIELLPGKQATLMPSVKRIAGQAGWQILESEKVQEGNDHIEDHQSLSDFLAYNAVDIINEALIKIQPDFQIGFDQHSQLLERFSKQYKNRLGIDSTNAKFIEFVIAPDTPLTDNPQISLDYPVKDENGNYTKTDLLEYINKDVGGLDKKVYNFYKNIQGASSAEEATQRNNGATTISTWILNADKKPIDAYITNSIGGAHGEYSNYEEWYEKWSGIIQFNLALKYAKEHYFSENSTADIVKEYSENKTLMATLENPYVLDSNGQPEKFQYDLKQVITAKSKKVLEPKNPKNLENPTRPKKFNATVFGLQVVHVDVDSLYPTLLTNLGVYSVKLPNGKTFDMYGELRRERLKLKKALPGDKSSWTEQDQIHNKVQLLDKLLLNSATGISDAPFDNNIRANNKIVGMRVIGNLLITDLTYKMTQAGALPVSINTDGLYSTHIDIKTALSIIEDWKAKFNLSASPEIVDRFVSKDSNNRLEVQNGKLQYAGGAMLGAHKGPLLTKSLPHPAISDAALTNTLANDPDPLEAFNKEGVRNYISNIINEAKKDPSKRQHAYLMFQWLVQSSPSVNRYIFNEDLKGNYHYLHKVARGFLVKKTSPNRSKLRLISVSKQNATHDESLMDTLRENNLDKALKLKGNDLANANIIEIDKLHEFLQGIHVTEYTKMIEDPGSYQTFLNQFDSALKLVQTNDNSAPQIEETKDKSYIRHFISWFNSNMKGPKSHWMRTALIKYTGVHEDFWFVFDNRDLRQIGPELLDQLDIDAYVDATWDAWTNWSKRHVSIKNTKINEEKSN